MSLIANQINMIRGWVESATDILTTVAESSRGENAPPARTYTLTEAQTIAGVYKSKLFKARQSGELELEREKDLLLEDVVRIRDHFNPMGAALRETWDLDLPKAIVLAFMNFKGGCWKTTTAHHFSTWLASLGRRVLVIDLDAQASMTTALGLVPDIDTNSDNTIVDYVSNTGEFAGITQTEANRKVRGMIMNTHLPTLDVLPACLDLSQAEFFMAAQINSPQFTPDAVLLRLRKLVEGLRPYYDAIVIDGTPSLGLTSLNIVFACDTVIVPVPTERNDFASTQAFSKIYAEYVELLQTHIPADKMKLPQMLFLPTRYSKNTDAKTIYDFMKYVYGTALIPYAIMKHDAAVGNLALHCRTVFDTKKGFVISSAQRKKAEENFAQAFTTIYNRVIAPHRAELGLDSEELKA